LVGVVYQHLKNPEVSEGETSNADVHALTAIPWSINYNGKAFVAATFSSGHTFLFYDGTLVAQSRNGIVLDNTNDANDLAAQLETQVTAMGWTGDATGNYVDVKSPIGVNTVEYDPSTTDAKTLTVAQISAFYPGVLPNAATAVFKVTSYLAPATITIEAPNANGVGVFTIVNAEVINTSSLANAVAELVDLINTSQTSPDYTAEIAAETTDTIMVHGPAGNTDINGKFLVVTTSAGTDIAVPGVVATVSPTSHYRSMDSGPVRTTYTWDPSTVTVIGVTGAMTYLWELIEGGLGTSGVPIQPTVPNGQSTYFTTTLRVTFDEPEEIKTATYRCKVTTTAGTVYTNTVSIEFRLH